MKNLDLVCYMIGFQVNRSEIIYEDYFPYWSYVFPFKWMSGRRKGIIAFTGKTMGTNYNIVVMARHRYQ